MVKVKQWIRQETVLTISILLAFLSMFMVVPDREYAFYIDVRTLGILFCLMTAVAGLREAGVFDRLAGALLDRVKGITGIVLVLVFLCFLLSMAITNDVALITFVPLTILILNRMKESVRNRLLIPCVVLQTIAANLGSMLTPVGNPQNLYLYGKSGMSFGAFLELMLPYTAVSAVLLAGCAVWIGKRAEKTQGKGNAETRNEGVQRVTAAEKENRQTGERREVLLAWCFLAAVSLCAVLRLISFWIPFALVLGYSLIRNPKLLHRVDYSLLGTFAALFIFIGNLGRIPAFSSFLKQAIEGREVLTAVLASQVMSNVPAAILLSGFTEKTRALIVGTNLGGLGTLIASMASLISYKYIAKEKSAKKGSYLLWFTAANVGFLAMLLAAAAMFDAL